MLEAIYGDDLQHDEGESSNATELAAHLAALEVNATEAATIPVRAIGLHASAHYGARPPFPTGERHRGGDDPRARSRPACKCSLRRPTPFPHS